jgi:hypothetical protein
MGRVPIDAEVTYLPNGIPFENCSTTTISRV